MGRRIRCEHYKYRGADRKYRSDNFSNDYRVFVCNLQPMTSWQDLKDFGRTAGQSVTFADVRPMRSGASRGARELEGIIEYSDRRDFDHALQELDGARLNGVRVKVFSVCYMAISIQKNVVFVMLRLLRANDECVHCTIHEQ